MNRKTMYTNKLRKLFMGNSIENNGVQSPNILIFGTKNTTQKSLKNFLSI